MIAPEIQARGIGMILFLTLCYGALLAILVKAGVVKLTLWWKLSPLAWMLFLLIVLFVPMQWGAPAGDVQVFSYVVEIIPNVSGEVTEVPVQGSTPVEEGDVLFQIDRRPFQAEVSRLEAAFKGAEQSALILPTEVTAAKAAVAQAEAAVVESKKQADALGSALAGVTATVVKCEAQFALAQLNYNRAQLLLKTESISEEEAETELRDMEAAKANLHAAEANQEQAQLAVDSRIGGVNTQVIQAEESLRAARAVEAKAQLALESTVNGENTTVAQLRAQLVLARLNLEWTTVRAPSDGMVVNSFLRPGHRVGNMPVRSWMAFLDRSGTRVGVALSQHTLHHVKPGQHADVILKLRPGKTFSAVVELIAPMNSEGQIEAGGSVPAIASGSAAYQRFIVVLTFDDDRIDSHELPGGAVGTAAIYTEYAKMTHIIRRLMVRMKTWSNYVLP